MTTALHAARLAAVEAVVRAAAPARIVDLGCGAGDFLVRVRDLPGLERLAGLDRSHEALRRLAARLAAAGRAPAVELVHGSIEAAGAAFAGFDCAVLIETIEHVAPQALDRVEHAVFARMRPATVVLTTPNADYNPLLGVPPHRFRHPGHRFEWSRLRFGRWTARLAERHGYRVDTRPVGGVHPDLGGASQLAVFRIGG